MTTTTKKYARGLLSIFGDLTIGATAGCIYLLTGGPYWVLSVAIVWTLSALYQLFRWLRVDRDVWEYRRTLRTLWATTLQMPPATWIEDPETGHVFYADQRRLRLVLLGADENLDPDDEHIFLTKYAAGYKFAPPPSPLLAHTITSDDSAPAGVKQAVKAAWMARRTGVMNVELAQLKDVTRQLSRALDAAIT